MDDETPTVPTADEWAKLLALTMIVLQVSEVRITRADMLAAGGSKRMNIALDDEGASGFLLRLERTA